MSPVLVGRDKKAKRPPPVSVRIPAELLVEIEAGAKALKLTRHDAILQLLDFAVAKHFGRKPKKLPSAAR